MAAQDTLSHIQIITQQTRNEHKTKTGSTGSQDTVALIISAPRHFGCLANGQEAQLLLTRLP